VRYAPAHAGAARQRAIAGPIDALIHATALEFGHDPDLLRAIVKVESGFNTKAVSPKGAMGLMQLMPATARRFGVADSAALFSPGINLQAGARYLAYLRQLFPRNLELAIAAYNAGEGAVIQRNYRIPPFPETQSYVQQVLEAYRAFRARRAEGGKS
jgi:soluble lytic murein transglycosylase-like protein